MNTDKFKSLQNVKTIYFNAEKCSGFLIVNIFNLKSNNVLTITQTYEQKK